MDLYPQFTQVSAWGHLSDYNAERGNPSITQALLVEEILSKCREMKQLELVEYRTRGSSAQKELCKPVGLLLNNKPSVCSVKDH